MRRTRITSANLNNRAHDVSAQTMTRHLADLADGVTDVFVVQEARPGIQPPHGFVAVPNLGAGSHEDRILVRQSRRITGHGYMRAHRGIAGKWPARWFPWVTLGEDDTIGARDLTVIGVHFNSGIDAGGHWATGAADPRRAFTEAYIDSVIDLGRMARNRLSDSVVIVGDTNVDAYADRKHREPSMPSARFERFHFVEALPGQRSGTLGDRRVDRAFHSLDLNASVIDRARLDAGPGTHQAITVTVAPR